MEQKTRFEVINEIKPAHGTITHDVLRATVTEEGTIVEYVKEGQIQMSGDDYKLKNLLKMGVQLKPAFLGSAKNRLELKQAAEAYATEMLNKLESNKKEKEVNNE